MGANISADTAALTFRKADYDIIQATAKLPVLLDYG
jgi:hypothetical protein